MTDIAQLAIEIRSDGVASAARDLRNLEGEAKKAETASQRLERQFKQMERSLNSFGRSMSLYVTAPLVAAGGAAVKLAIDAEETANKFDVVFGPAADRARARLEKLTNTIPLTVAQMQALSSGVQDMLVPMGLARDEAARLSVDFVQLAGDIASFNNVRPDEALNAVQSALAGMSQPLRRYGIDVSQARLENLALEEGLISQGQAMTQAARAQAIMIAVTRDSSDAIGDAERTVDSAANQIRFLQRDIRQLGEEMGVLLIPAVTELVSHLRSGISVFEGMSDGQRRLAVQAAAAAAAIGPLALGLSAVMRAMIALRPLIVFMAGPAGLAAVAVGAGAIVGYRLQDWFRQSGDGAKSLSDRLQGLTPRMYSFNEEVARLRDEALRLNLAELESEILRFAIVASNQMQRFGEVSEGVAARQIELQEQYAETTRQIEINDSRLEAHRRRVAEAESAVNDLVVATGNLSEETERAASEWQNFGGIIGSNIAIKMRLLRIIRDANPELDEFGQFAQRAENHFGELTWRTDVFMRQLERLRGPLMQIAMFRFPQLEPELENVFRDAAADGIAAGIEQAFSRLTADNVLSMGLRDFGQLMGISILESVGRSVGGKAGELLGERIGESAAGKFGETLASLLPGIGGAAGGILGGILGRMLFGQRTPKFQLGGTGGGFAGTGAGRTDMAVNTALGQTMFRFRGIERQAQLQLRDAIQGMDAALAGIIRDEGQLAQMRQAIAQFGHDSRDEGATLQDVLEARFRAIIGTFDSFTRDIVMAGADLEEQFQRLADIVQIGARQNLGDNLGITWNDEHPIWMAHELARAGETLAQSFQRLLTITDALDTAVALTGNNLHGTRDEVIRFGDALMAAFGDDLQRLTRGLNTVFDAFFSDEERLNVAADQARQRAAELFERLGVDAADAMFTESGFRALFDSLFGTLDAESTAVLIEAGVAVSALIDAERELAELRGEVVDSVEDLSSQLADLMASVDRDLLRIISPARAQFAELAARMADAYTQAMALGASESELARIRELHHRSMQRMINDLTMSILRLADDLFGVEDSFTDIGNAIVRSTQNIRDAVIRSLERIDQWLDRSMLANFSPLTPTERLGEAQSQFQAAFAAAMGGDWDALANLPALADALLGEGAGFFGTSTTQFRELFDSVRGMMEQASGLTPPQEMQPPTFGQVEAIRSDASAFRIRLDELEQMQRAWQLGDQIGTLAELTEQTPYELARSLGFTDANMRQLLEALGHEIPHGTGLELADYFNDVVREIERQNPIARSIRDANQLLADHIGSMLGILELSLFAIGDVLVQILHQLGGEYVAPPWLPQFALGGPVHRTEPALVHQGEWVVPRNGALVMSDKGQTAILERMDNRLRNLERINGTGFATVADEERRTRQTMARKVETARV